MNKAQYEDYKAAVEHGLTGLHAVSTGACPGCDECGLEQKFEIAGIPIGVELMETVFTSREDAESEIEKAKADPDLAGIKLLHLRVNECEVNESQRELAEEPSFSWSPCDCCGSTLGGDRHPAHGLDRNGELLHLAICADCLSYLNYGQLDDMSMMEMEKD